MKQTIKDIYRSNKKVSDDERLELPEVGDYVTVSVRGKAGSLVNKLARVVSVDMEKRTYDAEVDS